MTDAATLTLRLNPRLDPEPFARAYARERIVRIPDLFEPDMAEAVFEILTRATPWRLVYADANGRAVHLSQEEIRRLGREGAARLQAELMDRARRNIGYAYNCYPMIEAYLGGWDQGHPIHLLTEFLNSPEFLEFGRRVIGAPLITKADAQATFYAPGHYLTRHVDDGERRERRAAYTLGFTKNWQPDWGGLLLLLDRNLDIARGFLPRFNMLTLFDGMLVHTVSCVSPFAGGGRYSITGWLRDDPAQKDIVEKGATYDRPPLKPYYFGEPCPN